MNICDTAGPDCSQSLTAEATSLLFDTRAPFEEWLHSLEADLSDLAPSQANVAGGDEIYLESAAGSECELLFAGILRVYGLLKRNIRSVDGTLVMSEQGRIEADVDVRVALIDGCVDGDIRASEQVVLERNARVAGNIQTPLLSVKDGAIFEGKSSLLVMTDRVVTEMGKGQANSEQLGAMAAGA